MSSSERPTHDQNQLDIDPLRAAFERGCEEGIAAGVSRATADGKRLGTMHGAALGGELGFLMGLGIAAPLLDAQHETSSSRAARASAQLVVLVDSLGLTQGAPLAAEIDVIATVGRARALGKVLQSVLALPQDFLAAAVNGGVTASTARSSSVGGPSAAAARSAIDF